MVGMQSVSQSWRTLHASLVFFRVLCEISACIFSSSQQGSHFRMIFLLPSVRCSPILFLAEHVVELRGRARVWP
jgi:hypothetical protein